MKEAVRGWPRIEEGERRVACHFCDCLHDYAPLLETESAQCQNCGESLYRNRPRSLQRVTSFALSALWLMFIVLLFPFLSIETAGLGASMTVWTCLLNLWEESAPFLAVGTALLVVILPLLMIGLLLYITIPLMFGRAGWAAKPCFRVVLCLERWVMVEVFFLGAIVSLVKIVAIATVKIGVGFWALGGVMFFLAAAMACLDKSEFWDRIESALNRKRDQGKEGGE